MKGSGLLLCGAGGRCGSGGRRLAPALGCSFEEIAPPLYAGSFRVAQAFSLQTRRALRRRRSSLGVSTLHLHSTSFFVQLGWPGGLVPRSCWAAGCCGGDLRAG